MKIRVLVWFVVTAVCSAATFSQELSVLEKMKKIEILTSTREDVIRLFGQPDGNKENQIWSYRGDSGELDITFTTGRCISSVDKPGTKAGWRLPQWIVQEVAFSPSVPVHPKKLNLDLRKFQATPIHDSAKAVEYFDEESGIYYIRNSKKKIEDIIFVAPKSLSHLRCKPSGD